jgi:hypothetical protein
MFIKKINKKNRNGELVYSYYRLCESYRIGKVVRQRTVLSLGTLDALSSEEQFKHLADRIESLLAGQVAPLFGPTDPVVEVLARGFYAQICEKKKTEPRPTPARAEQQDAHIRTLDDTPDEAETLVKLSTLSHDAVCEIGAEWMCLQAVRTLKLPEFFAALGWDQKRIDTTLIHIISKAVFPASEHKTAQWIEDNSAIKELFYSSPVTISRHQLYKSGLKLYQCKESPGTVSLGSNKRLVLD